MPSSVASSLVGTSSRGRIAPDRRSRIKGSTLESRASPSPAMTLEPAPSAPTPTGIRVVVIIGTVRPGNYTGKAAALVVVELRKRGIDVDVVDPAALDLRAPGVTHDPRIV